MKQRRAMVDYTSQISIRKQCEILAVSRSGFYYKPKGESAENLHYMELMDKHFMLRPTAGVLRMQDYLRGLGYQVNEKRVRRLLRLMGIEALYPKRNLSRLGFSKYVHPYLLRNLKISRPNQVWAIDITYIPMEKGFMYLTAIIDVYSRFIVGWGLSNTLTAAASHNVLLQAIEDYGCPEIINSDQGSQFTCKEWVELLKDRNIKISMDGKGRATDNAFIERFFRTLKYDHVYINPAKDGLELYQGIQQFIHNYNVEYCHQGIGRIPPVRLYRPETVRVA